MLFHISLGAKTLAAQDALKWALLSMTTIMNLQCTIASERLETHLAGCIWAAKLAMLLANLVVVVVVVVVVVICCCCGC